MTQQQRLEDLIVQLEVHIRTVNFASTLLATPRTQGCTHGCTGSCPDPTGNCTYDCTHGCTHGCTGDCGQAPEPVFTLEPITVSSDSQANSANESSRQPRPATTGRKRKSHD